MKKAILILLGISLALIVGGFAVFAASGFSIPGNGITFSTARYYSSPVLHEQKADAAQCSSVNLSLVNCRLTVKLYTGNQISLSYEEQYKGQWDYSLAAGEMKLEPHHEGWLQSVTDGLSFLRNGSLSRTSDVTLYVPKGCALDYRINDVSGRGSLAGITTGDLDINCVSSDYTLQDLTANGGCTLKGVSGSYTLEKFNAQSLKLSHMVSGSCEMQGCDVASVDATGFVSSRLTITDTGSPDDYTVKYSLVSGGVSFDGDRFSGSGRLGNTDAKKEITFDGVSSNLNVNFSK
ncbi:MAG: DUF4097 family beta strand repeat-containing protein [Clostridia bacterium]|nr:DUF4097 family beta strand repeat-containing protein [Clostridia bacterium]